MAYTRLWTEASPIDDDAADEIDDFIRNVRQDLRERMNDVLGGDGDWTTDDPVIPATHTLSQLRADVDSLDTGTGSVALVQRTIHWSSGTVVSSSGTITYGEDTLKVSGASAELDILIPVVLPVGVILTLGRARIYRLSANHTITGVLYGYQDGSSVAGFPLGSPTAGGAQWLNTAALNHTILADTGYVLALHMENNNLDTSTEMRFGYFQVQFTHPGGQVR